MKRIRFIISFCIWVCFVSYTFLSVLTHIPSVQHAIGRFVSDELGKKMGTRVEIGQVNLGFFNRIIIDDVKVYDRSQEEMLSATRLSAKFSYLQLLEGKISISSAQLFGLNTNFYRVAANVPPNYQFAIDALSSKSSDSDTKLELKINSLVIRRGKINYRERYIATIPGKFSLSDIQIKDLSAHIVLNVLNKDSVNVHVSHLSAKEHSGLEVESLECLFALGTRLADMQLLSVRLPHSQLTVRNVQAQYATRDGNIVENSLRYSGSIEINNLHATDISPLLPEAKTFSTPLSAVLSVRGTDKQIMADKIYVRSDDRRIEIQGEGKLQKNKKGLNWQATIAKVYLESSKMRQIAQELKEVFPIPKEVLNSGSILMSGTAGRQGENWYGKTKIQTDLGNVTLDINRSGTLLNAEVGVDEVNLATLLGNAQLGIAKLNLSISGHVPMNHIGNIGSWQATAKAAINRIDYNGYSYKNIALDAIANCGNYIGRLQSLDPNLNGNIELNWNSQQAMPLVQLNSEIKKLNLKALHLSATEDRDFSFVTSAQLKGNIQTPNYAKLNIADLTVRDKGNEYKAKDIDVLLSNSSNATKIELHSDFAQASLSGRIDYQHIVPAFKNIAKRYLPTLPGLENVHKTYGNDFVINARIENTDFLRKMFHLPVAINEPMQVQGTVNEHKGMLDVKCDVPQINYNGQEYEKGHLSIITHSNALYVDAAIRKTNKSGRYMALAVQAEAGDNKLYTQIKFNNNGQPAIAGTLAAISRFYANSRKESVAEIQLIPSAIQIGDTTWHVSTSELRYQNKRIEVNDFAIAHDTQHLKISGIATERSSDSLKVEMKDLNVQYILDLINFDAVSFEGEATGKGYVTSLFTHPEAQVGLSVRNFKFAHGDMGTLNINAQWNRASQQVDLSAIAVDSLTKGDNDRQESPRVTEIEGFVSPARNDIFLSIIAKRTRADFINTFCQSFLSHTALSATGQVALIGPLDDLNLMGKLSVSGMATVSPLNTRYYLSDENILFSSGKIEFDNDTLYDGYGGRGILTGSIQHKNLGHIRYGLDVKAENLLAYNQDGHNGESFYGRVYGTGICNISGGNGETNINVEITPEAGSEVVYDASSPTDINSNDFILWNTSPIIKADSVPKEKTDGEIDISGDIYTNFLIHTNPNAALKVIMDRASGDYVLLRGNGSLRANYYNKGAFNLFGNYNVNEGVYKLTIQNLVKRQFDFMPGGTIIFGGNPYDASLSLKAQYLLSGVSLADLQLGKSFSENNIKVNCLMNISGTPKSPTVGFDLDLPSVNSDAKQMIMSVLDGEEKKSQQVLYLLAVGRFYSEGVNNAVYENSVQQNQATLAMQSILSNQISQQISSLLSNVVNNQQWNFGANIATGNEGWNNAEYEGLVSGKLLNNRLLFNGQFGYRENTTSTKSFIGDFDLQYLLTPNGNISVRVYNLANDRYFIKNSMNTQGLGLLFKKDFNGWRDLLGIRRRNHKK